MEADRDAIPLTCGSSPQHSPPGLPGGFYLGQLTRFGNRGIVQAHNLGRYQQMDNPQVMFLMGLGLGGFIVGLAIITVIVFQRFLAWLDREGRF